MPTIYDYVNATEIASYLNTNPSDSIPYLGEELFPIKKQLGLDLKWIKGNKGLPVILTPSAFDAEATIRDRVGFKAIETEMPFFRESMKIGEKDRQELNKVLASGNENYIIPLITNIYDDIGKLTSSADVSMELMRMQLLSSGKISITANRVNLDYDYKFNANHKETLLSTARWSDTVNSSPVTDIQRWKAKVKADTGVDPTRAICTTKTWGYLMLNKSIKLDMNPIGGSNIIMTDTVLKTYFLAKLNINIEVYDKLYENGNGIATPFFADDTFTLLPPGNLGSSYYGTTPEESDLMSGGTDAQVQLIKNVIALSTIKQPHPVNVTTIVSSIMLPSFENIDTIFIATVA